MNQLSQRDFDSLMEPLIEGCSFEAEEAIKKQEELLGKLTTIHQDLTRINESHFKGKDEKIGAYLDRVMQQSNRVDTLSAKLEAMQKRVGGLEKLFKKLKEDIPELKKNVLLAEQPAKENKS